MSTSPSEAEILKTILENIQHPERLDEHPWTMRPFVRDALERTPSLKNERPGRQLIAALCELFPKTMPSTPPRRGKRLDNHWGEFGLLAARYFAPLQFGTPVPNTLRDAWGRIDAAILYSVYGKPGDGLSADEIGTYRLVGGELDYGCASTLSDWHKKGLQRFSEFILSRERYLARANGRQAVQQEQEPAAAPLPRRRTTRLLWLTLRLVLAAAIGLACLKAWQIYERGVLVYEDVTCLRELRQAGQGREPAGDLPDRCSSLFQGVGPADPAPGEVQALRMALPALKTLQVDLAAFEEEAQPLLWLSPRLHWLPVYGEDLAAAPGLIELAGHLLDAAVSSGQAAQPLLTELEADDPALDPVRLTALLVEARPALAQAREDVDKALAIRQTIAAQRLSPRLEGLLTAEIDPVLSLAGDGLSLATALPAILGAGSEGPKTYMLLAQNEDELRPTGGFITSVGNLVLHQGRVLSLEFESVDSDVQEDWSKPYPAAPWQLQEYMNSPVLILRDANWFSDFPTTALWVEYLYAYTHSHSVDGIVAFDQHFLVMLLGELGPLEVEGAPYPITAQNVVEYMRQAKTPPAGESVPAGWYRKEFIGNIAAALLNELEAGTPDWRGLARILSQALAERHLLLQFDDPAVAALAAERGWDDALRPGEGDYLMVTDTNIGFNKTNAVVEVALTYDIDLTDLAAPESTLTVMHANDARKDVPCIQWHNGQITGEEAYPINRCYWNYLRVYKQAGAALLESTPHFINGRTMLLGRSVPARVDRLEEDLQGVEGFGTLLVVPGGESWSTGFQFSLPGAVVSAGNEPGELVYRLRVQKQPGTLAAPLTIRIHLPGRAALKSTSLPAVVQGQSLLIETNLQTDAELEVVFVLP
jgi:hypothetical protein